MLNEIELLHEVVFWKWVNDETIMMVTENSAHLWTLFRGKCTITTSIKVISRFIFRHS